LVTGATQHITVFPTVENKVIQIGPSTDQRMLAQILIQPVFDDKANSFIKTIEPCIVTFEDQSLSSKPSDFKQPPAFLNIQSIS
jgi:hypothetical protein